MRTFLAAFMAVFLISLPVADQAEAKRFGGGSSFGKMFSSPKKANTAPAQKQAAPTTAPKNSATAAPKRGGFGGLMAGVLAGGIFGALLFGGAFDGIQFMDLLLIAGVIFIIFKIMSMRKQSSQRPSYAGGAEQYEINPHTQPQERQAHEEEKQQPFTPMPSFNSGWGESEAVETPSWFNKEAFVEGAREHFMTLQSAWDRSDWDEIQSYTTPELFESLKSERSKLPEAQSTEVVSVMADMVNFIDKPDQAVVSINFYGWLKEDSTETTEFSETWHLTRDMSVEGADWFIAGIEQS